MLSTTDSPFSQKPLLKAESKVKRLKSAQTVKQKHKIHRSNEASFSNNISDWSLLNRATVREGKRKEVIFIDENCR